MQNKRTREGQQKNIPWTTDVQQRPYNELRSHITKFLVKYFNNVYMILLVTATLIKHQSYNLDSIPKEFCNHITQTTLRYTVYNKFTCLSPRSSIRILPCSSDRSVLDLTSTSFSNKCLGILAADTINLICDNINEINDDYHSTLNWDGLLFFYV